MSDSINKQPSATVKQDVTDLSGRKVGEARAEINLEGLPKYAKVWYVLGPTAAIVVFMMGLGAWSLYSMDRQIGEAREERKELLEQLRTIQEKSYDRYQSSRENADRKHAELVKAFSELHQSITGIKLYIEWAQQKTEKSVQKTFNELAKEIK